MNPPPTSVAPDSLTSEFEAIAATQEPSALTIESETPISPVGSTKPEFKTELQIFLSTFFTIFLAEVGDKTQLTVLLMSAESHAPWIVFLGASAALVATSLCGVLLGKWLSTRIPPKTLETSAGLLLLGISALLMLDVLRG